MPLKGADMLVPRRVIIFDQIHTQPSNHIDSSIWCITLVVAPFVWSGFFFFCQPPEKTASLLPLKKKNKKLQNTNKVGTLQRIHQIPKKMPFLKSRIPLKFITFSVRLNRKFGS